VGVDNEDWFNKAYIIYGFAALELSAILVNIFSKSSMLMNALSSKTGFNSSLTSILRPHTLWETFFLSKILGNPPKVE